MMTKEQLTEKFGITIVENGYFNYQGRYVRLYDIYSADGCCWEKGLQSVKAIYQECQHWKDAILRIKNICAQG